MCWCLQSVCNENGKNNLGLIKRELVHNTILINIYLFLKIWKRIYFLIINDKTIMRQAGK